MGKKFQYLYILLIINSTIITFNTICHIFVLCKFPFDFWFHIENVIINLLLIIFFLLLKYKVTSFTNLWFNLISIYMVLLFFVILIDLYGPISDIMSYISCGDPICLSVDKEAFTQELFRTMYENFLNQINCLPEDIDKISLERKIEPSRSIDRWASNASRIKYGFTTLGYGTVPLGLGQLVAPLLIAKIPYKYKVGSVAVGTGFGMTIEAISKWTGQ